MQVTTRNIRKKLNLSYMWHRKQKVAWKWSVALTASLFLSPRLWFTAQSFSMTPRSSTRQWKERLWWQIRGGSQETEPVGRVREEEILTLDTAVAAKKIRWHRSARNKPGRFFYDSSMWKKKSDVAQNLKMFKNRENKEEETCTNKVTYKPSKLKTVLTIHFFFCFALGFFVSFQVH